jgi:hypothetical protein
MLPRTITVEAAIRRFFKCGVFMGYSSRSVFMMLVDIERVFRQR